MNIKIKFVEQCPNGEYGLCEVINNNNILIQISRIKNREMSEFFVTLLHEILHAWMFILKANKIRMPIRKEHTWIYRVQAVILTALKDVIKDKK